MKNHKLHFTWAVVSCFLVGLTSFFLLHKPTASSAQTDYNLYGGQAEVLDIVIPSSFKYGEKLPVYLVGKLTNNCEFIETISISRERGAITILPLTRFVPSDQGCSEEPVTFQKLVQLDQLPMGKTELKVYSSRNGEVITKTIDTNAASRYKLGLIADANISVPAKVIEGLPLKIRVQGELDDLCMQKGVTETFVRTNTVQIFLNSHLDLSNQTCANETQSFSEVLEVAGLDAGTYHVQVMQGDGSVAQKFSVNVLPNPHSLDEIQKVKEIVRRYQ